jgi:hypothetical protein
VAFKNLINLSLFAGYNFIVMQASSIEITAKKTHYGVDGTGRDTYINFDNGGNYRGHVQHGLGKFERGEFPTGGRGRINSSYVPIEGRPLHYIGDGTGRDTYIMYFHSYAELRRAESPKDLAKSITSWKI